MRGNATEDNGSTNGVGVYLDGNSSNNVVEDNDFEEVSGVDDNGSGNTVKHNRGYTTENSGSATISNGTDNAVVGHGLEATPTKVAVTGGHTEVANLYVDTVGATNFTVHAKDGNVTGDRTVYWEAET